MKAAGRADHVYVREYPVIIGGKEHMLRYDINAFIALMDTGLEYDEIIEMATSANFKTIPMLLWAGLHHEETDLTAKDIAGMIGLNEVIGLIKLSARAILQSAPTETETEAAENKKKQDKGKEKQS